MLLAVFLALAGTVPAPQVKPPVAAGVEVALEDQALLIPPLPSSVADAARDYGRIRKELKAAFGETERYLAACLKERDALGALDAKVIIPGAFGGEAKALAPFLFDARFLELKGRVLDRWNAWQSVLLRQGMNDPKGDEGMAYRMLILSSTSDTEGAKVVPTFTVLWRDPVSGEADSLVVPTEARWVEVLAVDRMGYGGHSDFMMEALAYADKQTPGLSEAWKPLTAHLNQGARELLDLDRTQVATMNPGMRSLRLVAKINFLTRFRAALWFCQVAWAHMASERILSIGQMQEKWGGR